MFRHVLEAEIGNPVYLERLAANEKHRGTREGLMAMLQAAGFTPSRAIGTSFTMRYLDGSALLRHYLTLMGFLGGWKAVVDEADRRRVFDQLEHHLNHHAEHHGELRIDGPGALPRSHPRVEGAARSAPEWHDTSRSLRLPIVEVPDHLAQVGGYPDGGAGPALSFDRHRGLAHDRRLAPRGSTIRELDVKRPLGRPQRVDGEGLDANRLAIEEREAPGGAAAETGKEGPPSPCTAKSVNGSGEARPLAGLLVVLAAAREAVDAMRHLNRALPPCRTPPPRGAGAVALGWRARNTASTP